LGGPEVVTTAERIIITNAVHAAVELEKQHHQWAKQKNGATVHQFIRYIRGMGAVRRNLETLGLKRRSKDITPDLQDYLRNRDVYDAEDTESDG
jgi:hypothetical protein